MNTFIDYLQAHLKPVIGVCIGLLICIVGFAMIVDTSHAHTWVEKHIPFFWSLFGFAAAATIIGFTRWFGRSGIQAREDYYESPALTTSEEN